MTIKIERRLPPPPLDPEPLSEQDRARVLARYPDLAFDDPTFLPTAVAVTVRVMHADGSPAYTNRWTQRVSDLDAAMRWLSSHGKRNTTDGGLIAEHEVVVARWRKL